MGDESVIVVDRLSKRYRLGQIGATSLRESVERLVDRLRGRPDFAQGATPGKHTEGAAFAGDESRDEIWALRDVSFEVKRGEVLGIIGRNGAGKSTLLKILSRITEPTSGRAVMRGRVGSLLEVGTGFHPELTGCENIFLNGAILGMKKREIEKKFDEIVAFAEIERFIDTPVKRYSSGMYVRLAFAVAAHLEPEILLVDEVLAVGDAAFQKKCLGKMGTVAREGRTVLFVSHNMEAIRRLCGVALWFDAGEVRQTGSTEHCVSAYLLRDLRNGGERVFLPPHRLVNGMPVDLHSVRIEGPDGNVRDVFSARSSISVLIEWENLERLYKPRIGFVLLTADGQSVFTALDATSWKNEWIEPGRRVSSCVIPGQLLNEGQYILDMSGDGLGPGHYDFTLGRTGAVLRFAIEDDGSLPNKYYGEEGFRDSPWPGTFLPNISWRQELVAAHGSIL